MSKIKDNNSKDATEEQVTWKDILFAVVVVLIVVCAVVESCVKCSATDVLNIVKESLKSNAFSIYLSQISVACITVSVVSVLSERDIFVLWEDCVQTELIKAFFNIKKITISSCVLIGVELVCIGAGFYFTFFLCFILSIVIIFVMIIKVLNIFFGRENKKVKMVNAYRDANQDEQNSIEQDLWKRTIEVCKRGDYRAVKENLKFYVDNFDLEKGVLSKDGNSLKQDYLRLLQLHMDKENYWLFQESFLDFLKKITANNITSNIHRYGADYIIEVLKTFLMGTVSIYGTIRKNDENDLTGKLNAVLFGLKKYKELVVDSSNNIYDWFKGNDDGNEKKKECFRIANPHLNNGSLSKIVDDLKAFAGIKEEQLNDKLECRGDIIKLRDNALIFTRLFEKRGDKESESDGLVKAKKALKEINSILNKRINDNDKDALAESKVLYDSLVDDKACLVELFVELKITKNNIKAVDDFFNGIFDLEIKALVGAYNKWGMYKFVVDIFKSREILKESDEDEVKYEHLVIKGCEKDLGEIVTSSKPLFRSIIQHAYDNNSVRNAEIIMEDWKKICNNIAKSDNDIEKKKIRLQLNLISELIIQIFNQIKYELDNKPGYELTNDAKAILDILPEQNKSEDDYSDEICLYYKNDKEGNASEKIYLLHRYIEKIVSADNTGNSSEYLPYKSMQKEQQS